MPDPHAAVRDLGRRAFARAGRGTWRRQLRSATLLGQIRHSDARVPEFTFRSLDIARLNDLVRLAELTRSPRERRQDPGELPAVAQTYADLAESMTVGNPRRAELLALAASSWSLAGYQANSAALADQYLAEIDQQTGRAPLEANVAAAGAPAAIAVLVGAILRRDVNEVARLGAMADLTVRGIGRRFLDEVGEEPLDPADTAVLAAYGLVARAARALARFWRLGDRAAAERAVADVRRASKLMLDACVVDTWVLVDNLAHVIEDVVATSPWHLLRRTPRWNALWERYLRSLALTDRPVVQVWPSQRNVLDSGLLDIRVPNLTVTMPTSAGKTHLAEWAILHALSDRAEPDGPQKLAIYVVPSRALAGEIERHLARSLGAVGLRVSGLFGGSEHVQYELRLIETTDVLVVTSEKLDLLLRNDETIAQRMVLLVADEGHLLGERDRGLRLELVITRVLRQVPQARVLVLSAVLPNGEEVARWLDPSRDGTNLVEVQWSPSGLRVGVFTWQGREVDGQQGVVRYRDDDADHNFFLPFVITRRLLRTRFFPTEKKDIAAELALHYGRLGPVLIAAPKKASTATAARAVAKACTRDGVAFGTDASGTVLPIVIARRERVAGAVASVAGADHELARLVRAGIGYHHAGIHETIRLELEAAFREGAIHVLCATSTLGQGVNLPAKTVIFSGTWRGQNDELPVRDFWNIAGRAARPFFETEGHVILIAAGDAEATRLRRRYLDRDNIEAILSTLAHLYIVLVRARLGSFPNVAGVPDDLDFGDDVDGEVARWAETLDLQLLSLLAEEVVDTDDEALLLDAVRSVLGGTFGGVQLGAENYPIAPLARFAARRVGRLATRVPDRDLRKAFLRTGLSLAGCESAHTAAQAIAAAISAEPAFLDERRWTDLRHLLLHHGVQVAEIQLACEQEKVAATAFPALAADWMDGVGVDDLRRRHGTALGTDDPMKFAAVLDRIVVHDLAWVLSAIIQLLEHERGEPLVGHVNAVAAMAKYGVATEPACYASSVGVRNRDDALALGALFPTMFGVSLPLFLAWVSTLTPSDVTAHVGPDTARLFLDRAAALLTPQDALDLLVTETGNLFVPLRGIGPMRTALAVQQLAIGDDLTLVREYDNPADENAIAVITAGRRKVGYVAREVARVLAPLLDLEEGPLVAATLAIRPATAPGKAEEDVHAALDARDAVRIEIVVRPRDGDVPA
jgi:hypothetical protein